MVETTEDVFRFAEEGAAGIRQRHVMTTPIEERDAHLRLELADLLAERRLRGVQTGRGAREIQLVGDRDEVPEMPELHPGRLDGDARVGNRKYRRGESLHVLSVSINATAADADHAACSSTGNTGAGGCEARGRWSL